MNKKTSQVFPSFSVFLKHVLFSVVGKRILLDDFQILAVFFPKVMHEARVVEDERRAKEERGCGGKLTLK